MGRARHCKLGAVNRQTAPGQPAQQANHQHQIGLLGINPGQRVGNARVHADHRPPGAHRQAAAQVMQEQAEIAQALAQCLVQVRLLDKAATDQGKAAQRHAMAVEAKELIVQQLDLRQP
ncbi:hypothetical protein D3C81_1497250 [compost metagenome]